MRTYRRYAVGRSHQSRQHGHSGLPHARPHCVFWRSGHRFGQPDARDGVRQLPRLIVHQGGRGRPPVTPDTRFAHHAVEFVNRDIHYPQA